LARGAWHGRRLPGRERLWVPKTSSADRIDLLLSTDLLSEGVNLQDAEVVVHLDIPWTAARLEQRVGRLARMGSKHSTVTVYLIRPPASAAALLENEIVPMYYERDKKGLPRRWLQMMRNSMASTIWQFSTSRMLEEYVEKLYLSAAEQARDGQRPTAVRPRPKASTAA